MTWDEAQNIVSVLVTEMMAGKKAQDLSDQELILYVQACELLGRMVDQAG